MACALGGCGYNLPLLARPDAVARVGPTAAPREPSHDASPQGQLAEARERAVTLPADAYWPYRVATLCVSLDSLELARATLNQSLARDPGYAPALALASRLDYATAHHDDAIAVLESARMAAQRESKDLAPELLAGLALHYDAAGRETEAQQALADIPKEAHRAADAAAATIALRHDDRGAAARLAETAVHESPNSAACQNNAGIARLQAGDVRGARAAFLAAIALDATLPGPYYNLALLEKFYTFDDVAALGWFTRYRALSSDDPDGLGPLLGQPEKKDLAEGSNP
jgi:hypothetical protein